MELLLYLKYNQTALFIVIALLGLIFGSFLNVVIYRLPIMLDREWRKQCKELLEIEDNIQDAQSFNLVFPRSRCPHCNHLITAWENIPILSYLWQKGRCTACQKNISLRYPIVEFLSALMAIVVTWHFGFGWALVGGIILTWILLAASLIDLDTHLLPDDITLPLLWLGLLFNLFGVYTSLNDAVIGAMAGYLSLWSVFWLFKLVTGKEGMGYGDFKLLAALGAWFGWQMLPMIILLSAIVGAIVGIGLILLRGHDRNIPIPFGPYLAGAGWLSLVAGEFLQKTYYGWVIP
jgi:leader peptidase (prepilin peptidase)/N-methyltransferase